MILTYADGSRTEGFLLARTEDTIRVAIPGCDDPMEFTDVHGTWVSEDCEPVRVEFAWQRTTRNEVPSEADCICSHELAAHLIHLLWSESDVAHLQTHAPLGTLDRFELGAVSRGN